MSRESRIARAKAKRRRQQRPWIVAGVVLVLALVGGGIFLASRDGGEAVAASCVAPTGELPEGAPEVPVEVGPAPQDLVVRDLVAGDGQEAAAGDIIRVHYVGVACSTGEVFDSSYDSGEAVPLSLEAVIEGWKEGIPGMKVGGQRLLGIPSDQAYGEIGSPPVIGPNEALWFVVELVSVGTG